MSDVAALVCDLDGVVYRGEQACPGAVEGLADARAHGLPVLFMTNNASRTPEDVAAHLTGLGVEAGPADVLTASQVLADTLAREYPELLRDDPTRAGAPQVLAVGGPGLAAALAAEGLAVTDAGAVRAAAESGEPLTVPVCAQGYGAEVGVSDLTEIVYAIAGGARWYATNDDATLPTPRGFAPGNGSLLAAVAHASGTRPEVVGKPHAPAYRLAARRLGVPASACLMIGDRVDTDIVGAARAGMPSALVLTGVSGRDDAESLAEHERPTYVAETIPDLAHLWRTA